MDPAAYRQWWEVHVRVARGEQLSPEERTRYEAGRQELEKDEQYREVQNAREIRDRLTIMEKRRGLLDQHRQKLYVEIASLEKQLPQQTQFVLGVKE